jgi:6-phosphofructokinase 1
VAQKRGTIAILTGGGDVPGLNPAIRAITKRAIREGYRVLGIRRGWAGLVDFVPEKGVDNSDHIQVLTEEIVDRAARTGGTFLHTSRTRPSFLPKPLVPERLEGRYSDELNDVTPEVLRNLEYLGIDVLVPIGGDDTLRYACRLHKEGVNTVAIPKTMDNDVPGTDYCIGFSTCVTRVMQLAHDLRTTAGSHERFLVIEVFGRYAGFTALLPTMAGAADRCVIPEHPVHIEQLAELLSDDRRRSPSRYAVCLVSEGARLLGETEMVFEHQEEDQYGHKKLGGVGDRVGSLLKEISPKFNEGRRINLVNQRLGGPVRRAGRARRDRSHGLRQRGPRPGPRRRVGEARQRPQGLLRLRTDQPGDRIQEDGRGEPLLQHRAPAPHVQDPVREPALHHDELSSGRA